MSTTSQRSLREYRRRINAVIDHIERHLGEDLLLEDLARVACFSPWHFHRVFTAVTGETVSSWIKRTRVQVAADRLRYDPDKPVTTVAYELGFSSPSVLNRAFRDQYGCTPTQWRERGYKWDQADRKEDQASRNQRQAPDSARAHHDVVPVEAPEQWSDMMNKITVQDLPDYRIAYFRAIGPYEHDALGKTWEDLGRWAGPRGLMGPDNFSFGVSHDNPEVTPPEKCRYDAGVAIPEDMQPESPVTVATLPAGQYAVLKWRGHPGEIGEAFLAVFKWMTENGWQPDHKACYQRYGSDMEMDPKTQVCTCDICCPVMPL